ncbi:MAG: type II toxin-antitoxin system RelE/ParE family toxin [Hyphomicrobiaceae bacterium]
MRGSCVARLVKSPQFDADVEAIWLSIAERHVATADRVIERIEAVIERASHYPLMGTPVPHLAPNLRRLRSGPYLIYCRYTGGELQLVRALHGRRQITPEQFQ